MRGKQKTLVDQARELQQKKKSLREAAEELGFVVTNKKKGTSRVSKAGLALALLKELGFDFGEDISTPGKRPGREVKETVTVHNNGAVVIGATRLKGVGLEPGDKLRIRVTPKKIVLLRTEEASEEEADEADALAA